MNAQASERAGTGRDDGRVLTALLACGIVSSILYIGGEIAASMSWAGYSYANQAVSELVAIGAPTRPFMLALFAVYNLLVIAFAAGVWRSAGTKRPMRIAAVMLIVYAVVGQVTQVFSPMNPRGSVATATDVGHIVLTTVEVLSIVAFIAFGSGARGGGFRIYSVVSILVIMAGGIVTGMLSTQMTALASSTPWAGLTERVNIYGTMLWIAAFALARIRATQEAEALAAQGGRVRKVTAFVGSAHKSGATFSSARRFLDDLESLGGVETEIVGMGDYRIEPCRGCKVCFAKGEEMCTLKDDRDALTAKLLASDGVVFASPNYSFQVSSLMKLYLDRLGYLCHRPACHGKTATSLVVQGFYGGDKIVKYLDFLSGALGFNVVKGSSATALEPMTDKERAKRDRAIAKQAARFHERLFQPAFPVPSLLALMIFRVGRAGMLHELDERSRDYTHYRDKGWFESDFYYPTHLGPVKKLVGRLFDSIGAATAKARS